MKRTATVALMLNLGVASLYAQQRPVEMTFSGSIVPTSINLKPNTITDEELSAGNGTLGNFTFRKLRTDETSPQSFGSCGGGFGPNFRVVAGGGVFRFEDGSLLTTKIMGGASCIDVTNGTATLTVTDQVTGGTGIFKNATGTLKYTIAARVLLVDATMSPVLIAVNGEGSGTIVLSDTL